jgi:superfamily II DNA helicase RecQ
VLNPRCPPTRAGRAVGGHEPVTHTLTLRGPLDRTSLVLSVVALPSAAERLAEQLPRLPGSGIVYCQTVPETRRVAAWLQANGVDATPTRAATTRRAAGGRGGPGRQRL